MRIIAGSLSGRQFGSPGTRRTHPMSDRMRGGLFNVLGDIGGLRVLDAFAGSGALGLEAASRGAGSVLLIEQDRTAQRTIQQNIRQLQLGMCCRLINASVSGWLTTSLDSEQFDIIMCDPPYHDLQLPVISRLTWRLATNGVFVLSWPGRQQSPQLPGLDLAVQKAHGDAQLAFYTPVPL